MSDKRDWLAAVTYWLVAIGIVLSFATYFIFIYGAKGLFNLAIITDCFWLVSATLIVSWYLIDRNDTSPFWIAWRVGAFLIVTVVFPAMFYGALSYSFVCLSGVREHVFWEALYFSVVTFTSLGYGDFVPLGRCRAIASVQALLGIVSTPVFIALTFELLLKKQRFDRG